MEFGIGRERGGNGRFNSTDLRWSLGARGQVTRKSALHLNLGVMRKNLSENPAFIDDFTGPFLELIHIWRATRKTTITTVSSFNTENSFFANNTFFGTRYGKVEVGYEMTRRIKFLTELAIRRNKHGATSSVEADGDSGQRSDWIVDLKYGLAYAVRKNIFVEGGYAFTIRDSNFDPQDYRQHVLSLGFRGEL
jgi:hypothetical protein